MRQSSASRLLGLQVRNALWAWMFVIDKRCWLTVRWLSMVRCPCVELVTHHWSSKVCSVSEIDCEAWTTRRPWPSMGCCAMKKQIIIKLSLPPFSHQKDFLLIFIVCLCTATLTEVFSCFFLSCKANARVKFTKIGHGPQSS
jgi:hypothetical protein